jgi:hypothetical protein
VSMVSRSGSLGMATLRRPSATQTDLGARRRPLVVVRSVPSTRFMAWAARRVTPTAGLLGR